MLTDLLEAHGYVLGDGQLETYPAEGKALRAPCQSGCALLNLNDLSLKFDPDVDPQSPLQNIEHFLLEIDDHMNSLADFKNARTHTEQLIRKKQVRKLCTPYITKDTQDLVGAGKVTDAVRDVAKSVVCPKRRIAERGSSQAQRNVMSLWRDADLESALSYKWDVFAPNLDIDGWTRGIRFLCIGTREKKPTTSSFERCSTCFVLWSSWFWYSCSWLRS